MNASKLTMALLAAAGLCLAGKIQETYGISKDIAEKQLSDWEKGLKDKADVK